MSDEQERERVAARLKVLADETHEAAYSTAALAVMGPRSTEDSLFQLAQELARISGQLTSLAATLTT